MSSEDRAIELEKLLSDSYVLKVGVVEDVFVIDYSNGARLIVEDFMVEED